MRRFALVSALAALVALAGITGGAAGATAAACPGFRVLHDDRIGPAILPAGNYAITIAPSSGLTCAAASRQFTRFLEDYDGILPRPWTVVAGGTGKADFEMSEVVAFSVSRSSGGGGGGSSSLGVLCNGPFSVNSNVRVGPLFFPKGGYLLYIPPRSAITCNRASVLFARFLEPDGMLPSPWRTIAQSATFYKPAYPQRSAFRVEPLSGAGGGSGVPVSR